MAEKTRNKCDCDCYLEEIVEWFKHKSNGRDDPDLFDGMDEHGSDSYYVYYAVHEIYAQMYNEADEDGYIIVSLAWMLSQLNAGERKKSVLDILTFYHLRGRILSVVSGKNIKICIPAFIDVASNWVKRKRGGKTPPAEAPPEAPAEAPLAVEEERKKKEEEDIVSDVIDYLNKTGGTSYRKAARESVNHIKGRAKEGATLDDFKLVIDSKVAEWGKDEKMFKYLRPSTLFNSEKFWGYLNAAKMGKTIKPGPVGGGYRGSGVAI